MGTWHFSATLLKVPDVHASHPKSRLLQAHGRRRRHRRRTLLDRPIPDYWWADAGNTRLTLAKWVSEDRILFVDGTINHMLTIEGKLYVDRMTPLVVFALRPELPAGRITRERDIEREK